LVSVDFKIRPETADDHQAIESVTIAAFRAADYKPREHLIVSALRSTGQLTISLVAEHDDRVVGHVAASPVDISDGSSGWHGLGPVSVVSEYQRRGIGSALVREMLRALLDIGAAGCVVLGNPDYYGRFGFRAREELRLPDVPAKYFQALLLGGDWPCGVVTYHEAFTAASV
jgi:putative acetyltransferase